MHSNRQQWTLNTGEGVNEQLPQNFLAKRITTKLHSSFAKGLSELGVLIDFNKNTISDTAISLSDFSSSDKFDIELYFSYLKEGNIFSITPNETIKLEVKAFISSYQDIDRFSKFIEKDDLFILNRDKYIQDYVFGQIEDGSLLKYLGGPLNNLTSWEIIPTSQLLQGTYAVSKFDPKTNPDCELPVSNHIKKIWNSQSKIWRECPAEIILSASGQDLILTIAGKPQILSQRIELSKSYYVSIHIKNSTRINDILVTVNSYQERLLDKTYVKGFFNNMQLNFENKEEINLFRIYDRFLSQFEESSNYNFLT